MFDPENRADCEMQKAMPQPDKRVVHEISYPFRSNRELGHRCRLQDRHARPPGLPGTRRAPFPAHHTRHQPCSNGGVATKVTERDDRERILVSTLALALSNHELFYRLRPRISCCSGGGTRSVGELFSERKRRVTVMVSSSTPALTADGTRSPIAVGYFKDRRAKGGRVRWRGISHGPEHFAFMARPLDGTSSGRLSMSPCRRSSC